MKIKKTIANISDCSGDACPAVFEAENGDFIIIGEKFSNFGGYKATELVIKVPKSIMEKAFMSL